MKKWLIFIGGVLTGVILTLLFSFILSRNHDQTTWFESPQDMIESETFRVFQVLGKNAALVDDIYPGTVYLLTNNEGKYYYDNEFVQVDSDKVVRQIGIYQYKTKEKMYKTVPIIQIMDK
ncbi:MAG: hypothetical protein IKT83_00635 [Bacteroidaceae bacterium]|nr:hypothetical protein [Bacteroidaceae bacterium]